MIAPTVSPEFSRPVSVADVTAQGRVHVIVADADERAALARRFGIPAVDALEARVRLASRGGRDNRRILLTAEMSALVVQTCVVSLRPLPARVEERFSMAFAETVEPESGDIDVAPDAEDPPDPIVDGCVDIGEAVAEHLALALDPFPRAPDATFDPPTESEPTEEKPDTPFAVLAAMKKKEG